MKAELEEFRIGDGINVGVVGAGAIPGHQERDAFMKVVDDGGMPFVKHAVNGLGGFVSLLVGVAVDVHEGVLGPVGGRLTRKRVVIGLALEVAIKPVDHFVATVGIGNGVDEHDDVFADAANHGQLGNGQAVGELDSGFGRAGLVGVESGVEVVDGPGSGD